MIGELLEQSVLQWVAFVTGCIYVLLAARGRPECWAFGIICSAGIAWEDFTSFRLYADGVLQIIYVVLGFVGLIAWLSNRGESGALKITQWPMRKHALAIVVSALVSIPIWQVMARFTNAQYGYLDTLTTVLSLFATWLLIERKLGNWIYWIAIDVVYVYLYYRTGGGLIAALHFIYLAFAIYGLVEWRRKLI